MNVYFILRYNNLIQIQIDVPIPPPQFLYISSPQTESWFPLLNPIDTKMSKNILKAVSVCYL